jgi:UDP-N-acetylmuramoyl-tripeptide--D-alanyl-D-alanine ligase
MLAMTVAEIATACKGQFMPGMGETRVQGVTTDSRAMSEGALFVALKGDRFDGNDHAAAALANGAAACIVNADHPIAAQLPVRIAVSNTTDALAAVACAWRNRFSLPMIAITGSNGKTTVKEMLRSIALTANDGNTAAVLSTEGNLNNHIGVPLTLSKLNANQRVAIIEAGMNHFGELATLTRWIAPHVALITNAGPAHLEGLGSVSGVARAKAELLEGLDTNGVAVLNGDDPFYPMWREKAGTRRVIRFGRGSDHEVRGHWDHSAAHTEWTLEISGQTQSIRLNVGGIHNIMNALAAAAAAHAVGIGLNTISAGLSSFRGVKGRQAALLGMNGATLIDDTYNANPASMLAAVATLSEALGRKIMVLGPMAELGSEALTHHAELGRAVGASNVNALYATGELTRATVEACGAKAAWFPTQSALIEALLPQLAPQVTLLVKGSRSSAMEHVVAALQDKNSVKEKI